MQQVVGRIVMLSDKPCPPLVTGKDRPMKMKKPKGKKKKGY